LGYRIKDILLRPGIPGSVNAIYEYRRGGYKFRRVGGETDANILGNRTEFSDICMVNIGIVSDIRIIGHGAFS
jgi:hypothetical protein